MWGCPAEARLYKPHENKLDSRIVSCYFVGYPEKIKGFRFYDPLVKFFSKREMLNFLRMLSLRGKIKVRDVVFEEESVFLPHVVQDNNVDIPVQFPTQNQDDAQEEQTQQAQDEVPLSRSSSRDNNGTCGYITHLVGVKYSCC